MIILEESDKHTTSDYGVDFLRIVQLVKYV
jgi:hypothetical protein